MTYNNTLQGRFVAAGYPAVAMLFASLLLWVAGYLFSLGGDCAILASLGLDFIGDALSRVVSLLSYVCAAFLLGHIYIFERRVPFLLHIFLWLVSVQMFLHPDIIVAAALLFFLIAVAQLLSCSMCEGQEQSLYCAFAILSFSSLFLLQFAYLLPLFIAYLWVGNIFSIKNLFAALLGVTTPYWLLFGTLFVFPSLDALLIPLKLGVLNILTPAAISFSLQEWVTLAMELLVLVVAVSTFFASSLPAKPLLRRRLVFLFVLNAFLLIMPFVVPQDYALLLAWSLPIDAVMVAYVLSIKLTRLSNIYFIVLNILWLVIALLCLWNI